jgi:hypothetical protein
MAKFSYRVRIDNQWKGCYLIKKKKDKSIKNENLFGIN